MIAMIVSNNLASPVALRLMSVLQECAPGHTAKRTTYADAEIALFQAPPEWILVILSADVEPGMEVIRKLRRGTSQPILAVGDASDSKVILRVLNGGADQFIDENDLTTGLGAAFGRFLKKAAPQSAGGQVLAVLGVAGGCGASTLAVNLATAFTAEQGQAVLIDMKTGRGDLASLLDLRPRHFVTDVCRNSGRIDRAMFEKMLVRHTSGVSLLGSSPTFADARLINSMGVNLTLTLARELFTHVIADLEDCFHEEQATALKQAAVIYLVARLDFTCLRKTRTILEHFKTLGIPKGMVRIIINRSGQPGQLPHDEAEDALGEKIDLFVPDDPRIFNAAVNTGIPVVLREPNSKAAQAIKAIAKATFQKQAPKKSWLAALTRS